MPYIEVSAKTGKKIEHAFMMAVEKIAEKQNSDGKNTTI